MPVFEGLPGFLLVGDWARLNCWLGTGPNQHLVGDWDSPKTTAQILWIFCYNRVKCGIPNFSTYQEDVMDHILRINTRTKEIRYEETPDAYLKTGGRGLIAKILLHEVDPACEPLGRHNKLIFAMGLLTGTNVSSASRVCIGAKSPLTQGIKESNSGGTTAMRLAQLGLKAVILEDQPLEEQPLDDQWYYIKISKDECSLESASDYLGMGTGEFCEAIHKIYPGAAVSCIGPVGEMLYSSAGIATTDTDHKPGRFSGRGGLGAVMGSKKIKGIVVIGKDTMPLADKDGFMTALKTYTAVVKDAPSTLNYRTLGTASMVRVMNGHSGLPTCNFSLGTFDGMDNICGETMFDVITERGGEGRTSHACMPGCVIQCSNVYPDKDGKTIVSPLEYENIGLLGSNLGISDLDTVARLNALCNEMGIDTIETGAAIGVAMEAGLAAFGDGAAALGLMEEIRQGTVLGRLLGSGATITGKVLGVRNVPAINGQAFPAYDPRAIKGMGVTYATSPMGADHTYGATARAQIEQASRVGQADLSFRTQKNMAIYDTMGFCIFCSGAVGNQHQLIADLINARHGWSVDADWLKAVGEETLKDEHTFNQKAGFTKAHYRMPECFTERRLPGLNSVFDVTPEELAEVVDAHFEGRKTLKP
ncbi:aldehyde:ferredoxin oxidoreductase [Acidaminobacter hydrogenoformans DSM 2784]|uniref:Aldehyde:ferredoxin oxidoreductase n=2 Tax=Acidaminobacter TaxID=65402 RepID=A0A1G5S0K0_9FIRM|nr:aldehyde:ferredoxin oxidoreductase [Acidaminobacter hydrogenoformans DSM 2784]